MHDADRVARPPHILLAGFEWMADGTHGTNSPSSPSTSYTSRPMRVMIRMFTTTYGLSDSSTPTCAIGEPSGPIENGTTYSVRPRIEPRNRPLSVSRISAGSIQLLVGPTSSREPRR